MTRSSAAEKTAPKVKISRADRKAVKRIKKGIQETNMDLSLILVLVFLNVFGLIMVYSASSYSAAISKGDSLFYLKRQALFTFAGFLMMLGVSRINYRWLMKLERVAWVLAVLLMLAVNFTPFGVSINGQKRWFGIGSTSLFQAAEPVKIAVILCIACSVTRLAKSINSVKGAAAVAIWQLPAIALVAWKNLSSGIILAGIVFIVMFVASEKRKKYYALMAAVVGVILAARMYVEKLLELGIFTEYRLSRILVWKNPELYTQSGGYQVLQGLYAIGSGGFFGKGLGASTQKLGFVPEAQNDMIFSIICEELGLFGAICVILMFGFLLWRMLQVAMNAPDMFGAMLVVGVMAHVAVQVMLNIAVVTNVIPNTGITLPFISYGGTSVVFLQLEMGAVLSVQRKIQFKPLADEK